MRMHTERDASNDTLTWVVQDDCVTGFCTFRADQPDEAPDALKVLGSHPGVRRIEVSPGKVTVMKDDAMEWRDLATSLNQQVGSMAKEGALRFSDSISQEQSLRNAVEQIIDADLGNLAASHGGCISVVDIEGEEVQVSMEGACHNCPATRNTLDRNISGPLAKYFPKVKVRVVAGDESHQSSGPTFVRLLGLGADKKSSYPG